MATIDTLFIEYIIYKLQSIYSNTQSIVVFIIEHIHHI